ncbi:hypothetical protein L1049_014016 [Liquidambar formosana]|uniref:Transcription repressor n=1 Tax=Liquidambar formosana TaxID=63359 RepID=A0AAP0WZ22_LIQFO
MLKNVNSALSDAAELVTILDSSWSTNATQCLKSRESSLEETAFEALRSERLSFEPGNTNSIFAAEGFPFEECVVVAIESEDPYLDFRSSMEEMVEALGLNTRVKDWECLEELLAWYLRMNRKKNHGFIVGAFVDMFVGLPSSSSSKFEDK